MNHAWLDLLLYDSNPFELKYYPFTISLNKCTGSCNVLSLKLCVPKETKGINVKAFNIITNKNKAKAMTEYISCNYKCKFNSTIYNSNQKWNNKACQCECKNYRTWKKDYSWNPRTCICENIKYLLLEYVYKYLFITDTSVTGCDEIIIVMHNLSTKKNIAYQLAKK